MLLETDESAKNMFLFYIIFNKILKELLTNI